MSALDGRSAPRAGAEVVQKADTPTLKRHGGAPERSDGGLVRRGHTLSCRVPLLWQSCPANALSRPPVPHPEVTHTTRLRGAAALPLAG